MKLTNKKNRKILSYTITCLILLIILVLGIQVNSLQSRLHDSEKRNTELSASNDEKSSETLQLKNSVTELENQIATLSDTIDDLKSKIDASGNTTSGVPIKSLSQTCGSLPLPVQNLSPSQRDCYDKWRSANLN